MGLIISINYPHGVHGPHGPPFAPHFLWGLIQELVLCQINASVSVDVKLTEIGFFLHFKLKHYYCTSMYFFKRHINKIKYINEITFPKKILIPFVVLSIFYFTPRLDVEKFSEELDVSRKLFKYYF